MLAVYGCFVLIGAFGYYVFFLKPVFWPDKPDKDPYADISIEGQDYGQGRYEREAEARAEGLERDLSKIRNHGLGSHSLNQVVGLDAYGTVMDGTRVEKSDLMQKLDKLAETDYVMVDIKVYDNVSMDDLDVLTQSLTENGFDYMIEFR